MENRRKNDRRVVVYEPFLFIAIILLAGIGYLIFRAVS